MSPVLAADIGGTKIRVGLVVPGENPRVLLARSMPTEPEAGAASIARRLIEGLQAVAGEARALGHEPTALGVASAGVIDSLTGNVRSATDLIPGWGGTPLGSALADALGLPTAVLGDVHAHGLGEDLWGAAREADSALVGAAGTGIGGAHIVNGAVMTGAHDVAGHVGHLLHPAASGLRCSCGREGHVESIASGTVIESLYSRVTGLTAKGRAIDEAAEGGDALAARVVTIAGHALGETIGGLVNVLDPAIVVVSGSVANSGSLWWAAIRDGYAAQAMDSIADTPLVSGTLGGDAPLLGAAAFAARRIA